ncbi:hypothetical protein DL95DRAFT_449133 [Leptodontidium sp. 2 PMI_412]|nr:hypothetical protein DL95DRAFT_449133 [Leptodontidium sp. 2 PMI_412]
MTSTSLRDDDLQYFLQRTGTAPDCYAVKDDTVSLCATCSSAIAKRAIPPLSAGNFVNCLFCQDYPDVLKNLNTVEEAFIAQAHVVGIFLKLTSSTKSEISYRGSRGHSVVLCANNPGYKSVVVDYSVLDSWPDYYIPQEIRDAFITLGPEPGSIDTQVEDEREGYITSLRDRLFENELDAEVEDAEPGSILSRSFFSDLYS